MYVYSTKVYDRYISILQIIKFTILRIAKKKKNYQDQKEKYHSDSQPNLGAEEIPNPV